MIPKCLTMNCDKLPLLHGSLLVCARPAVKSEVSHKVYTCPLFFVLTFSSLHIFLLHMFQVPTILDKQGAHLLAVAFLVISRTFVSDRIASLNGTNIQCGFMHLVFCGIIFLLLNTLIFTGTTVKFVLEQDKASFVRLIGVSVLQSAASSFIAPSLRYC